MPLPITLGCLEDHSDRGEEMFCLVADADIEGNLTSPVTINPILPYFPYPQDDFEYTCVERSDFPMWTISDLEYDHVMPRPAAHAGEAVSNPGLSFNLTNLQNGLSLLCSLSVNEAKTAAESHPEQWLDCAGLAVNSSADIVETKVLWNRGYNLLAINQTWKCHDNIEDET